VATALAGEDGMLRINLTPGLPPSALARALVEAGWGLRELTPERTDLERVYFETLGLELGGAEEVSELLAAQPGPETEAAAAAGSDA
jgi:hypothetical protein